MNRRYFLKQSTFTGLALTTIPSFALSSSLISSDELIGKGSPLLFGNDYKLRQEAHEAFILMKSEALKDHIAIKIVSSYRNFKHQKRIWTKKYKRYTEQGLSPEQTINKIIEYSTIPGTSRHHWGTDIDIIDGNAKYSGNVLVSTKFQKDGPFYSLKNWMDSNANRFGFYLVYTDTINRKGFKYEPWHYSYKPLSQNYLQEYKKLEISKILQQEQLIGSSNFSEDFIKKYTQENILDINPKLL